MSILIVMINNCVQSNDTEYIPKASRYKRCTWLKEKMQRLFDALERKISMVMER